MVDVGNVIRQRFAAKFGEDKAASPQLPARRAYLESPVFRQSEKTAVLPTETMMDGAADASNSIEAPDWDTPISFRKSVDSNVALGTQNAPTQPPKPKSKWSWKWW